MKVMVAEVVIDAMIVMYKMMTMVVCKDYANVSRGNKGDKRFR